MKIISFDIGLKTCSVAIEQYDESALSAFQSAAPPKTSRYIRHGEATDAMKTYIADIARCGSVVHLEKKDLGDQKAFYAGFAFVNLYAWCEELSEHLTTADIILIEQQMNCNKVAIALMYHLQAWLLIHHANKVVLYPSKNKTRILGAPLKVDNEKGKLTKVTKYQRKKWSTQQADQMLKLRNDERWHKYIFVDNKSKKDDLSDVLMQTLSYVVGQQL